MLLHVSGHAGRASGTFWLAARRGVLAIQPLEFDSLLVIEHASEIVVVIHALFPPIGCPVARDRLATPADRTRKRYSRMRNAGTITPA